ncbi:MAG: glycosyltransferase family 2 protein [Anaerolineae bacterium]|nr:glycosyltransferase family 2 protein [Anaerolineae bacterium]
MPLDTPTDQQLLISCLCVTENRPAFMPWLLWCFDRQRWPRRELVIVDSSAEPFTAGERDDVRVLSAPSGMGVAAKRNLALEAAQGDIITWFDDDDWQHPDRLTLLADALAAGAPYAASRSGWFADLATLRCASYQTTRGQLIFNSGGFRRDAVAGIRFPEDVVKASDTVWMREVLRRHSRRGMLLDRDDLFFWLCHGDNLSNPARRRRFTLPLAGLQKRIGQPAWSGTGEALEALRARLASPQQVHAMTRTAPAEVVATENLFEMPLAQTSEVAGSTDGGQPSGYRLVLASNRRLPKSFQTAPQTTDPPISAMIKATVLDAPYLDVMVRHMLAQARYPFDERIIVVDKPAAFRGKYRSRPQGGEAEFDAVLERLLRDGVVDRVCPVDMASGQVRAITGRYFVQPARVPTHAATGGPIYATLFGLEAVRNDLVLQMDADLFFHSGETSWVRQAAARLAADPSLWLMMAHPGPPAGARGQSLRGRNRRRAVWDDRYGIWRFRTATTRYFLGDRRRLRGRLEFVPMQAGCAPLETCIGRAMQRHGGYRGNLGSLEHWHLHAWYHGDPFPGWAAGLAQAIEAGRVPDVQRGDYDLRLDMPQHRQAWEEILRTQPDHATRRAPKITLPDRNNERLQVQPAGREQADQLTRHNAVLGASDHRRTNGRSAAVAVVIPVRDRAGQRLRNALRSLAWQEAGKPAQVLVVSQGSQPAIDRELASLCRDEGVQFHAFGQPAQSWNKPLALNYGIRHSDDAIPFLMTMDADMVLAPNFLAVVLEHLQRGPDTLVLCRSADLSRDAVLPANGGDLLHAFDRLRSLAVLRGRSGTGGIQAARRSFFFQVRGYDEDLLWWGAMDGDMVNRAQLAGLDICWIEDRTAMLHQWHPRKAAGLRHQAAVAEARQAWRRNHALARSRAAVLCRNEAGWGHPAPAIALSGNGG